MRYGFHHPLPARAHVRWLLLERDFVIPEKKEKGGGEHKKYYRGKNKTEPDVSQVRRDETVRIKRHDKNERRERPDIAHRVPISGHSSVASLGRDVRQECIVKNNSAFKTNIRQDEQRHPGQDHSFVYEIEERCADNAHGREAEKESLPSARKISRCAENRGDGGRDKHRDADGNAPEKITASVSAGNNIFEVERVTDGDDDHRKRGIGKIE